MYGRVYRVTVLCAIIVVTLILHGDRAYFAVLIKGFDFVWVTNVAIKTGMAPIRVTY